jgi:hypothetical protein
MEFLMNILPKLAMIFGALATISLIIFAVLDVLYNK